LCLLAGAAFGQGTSGQITGTVTDATAAAVQGASLSVSNESTGLKRQTESNERGAYAFPLLPPGSYRVSVLKPGFRPMTRTNLELAVDQTARVDFALEVGAVAESVEVSAAAAVVDQDSSALGGPGKSLFGNARGAGSGLIGGWQLSGVFTARSGYPLVMSASIPNGGNRPNSTGKSADPGGGRTRNEQVSRWFDTSQFTQPAAFTFGNVWRTLPDARGPGYQNVDLSLLKNTKLRERINLQFRAEYFNLFNHPNFWQPNTTLGSQQFGQLNTTTGLPRVGQLALKLLF
jgi:hypothetical protein